MALSIETAFLVAILIAVLIFAGYLEWSFARGKMMSRRKTRMTAGVARDDAYNASVTSKAILRNLRAQGYDVSRAEPLIRQSDAELEMGNFTHAKLLADDARQALFEIKSQRTAAAIAPRAREQAAKLKVEKRVVDAAAPESAAKEQQRKLPRNYAEASFTIRSVEMEIAKEEGDENEVASSLLAEARKLFEGADYDGALRMAVRANRSLAGEVGDATIQAIPPQEPGRSSKACVSCGAPLVTGDSFCRKCGSKIGHACPSCGEPLVPDDTFCGKCGTRIPS